MKKIILITSALAIVISSSFGQISKTSQKKKFPIQKTDAEWKKILSPKAFEVMVKDGTETPYKNAYYNNHEKGIYVSAATGEPLFSSEDKYDSSTGWPSFTKPIKADAVMYVTDKSFGTERVEVIESKTGLHLGHVFDDGPVDKGGKRYCMNSAALKFIKNK
ncbi:MAG: peptide-methionine (R)-S-oxide reductase MsrB [Daejeonella sp.]